MKVVTHAGITLSKSQVKRGGELAAEQGLHNCRFQVMDALHMDFPDDTFDLVWACESGEHMPDKKKYIEEMTRVLKPGTLQAIDAFMHDSCPDQSCSQCCQSLLSGQHRLMSQSSTRL